MLCASFSCTSGPLLRRRPANHMFRRLRPSPIGRQCGTPCFLGARMQRRPCTSSPTGGSGCCC
ncbi:hypothetical protein B0H10DRAFT_2008619 [Mycena sp. CBHHK59/15]|nr:hypothetical protein B0H10DRAFT_2131286 [Mycena sp. CBHHK59/15]KAJ6608806.1 hypothetical protein B0H10DRAFT_2066599 [Mycena sp. CBHHK59/15]KAJ6623825.1 hypothetical protein B0H10DRAFT_2008619 [Mycena sp. CBHHK59/15]